MRRLEQEKVRPLSFSNLRYTLSLSHDLSSKRVKISEFFLQEELQKGLDEAEAALEAEEAKVLRAQASYSFVLLNSRRFCETFESLHMT